MIGDKATKRHRDRKSEGSAEVWRKRKKALNAARPKQVYVTEVIGMDGDKPIIGNGHWERR